MNDPTNPMPERTDVDRMDDENPDAVTLLRRQHDEIRSLMETVATGTVEMRETAFRRLVPLLAVHETAEEIVVYPALRRMGPEGERLADARTLEEDQAKKVLADLEGMGPEGASFATAFLEFQRSVEFHAEAEERDVFPLLTTGVPVDEQVSMGQSLLRAEKFAPTHAHRSAPESAVGNMIVGPFAAVVDRVRDALTKSRS